MTEIVSEEKHKIKLTKIDDNEEGNNYMEFADKSKFKLDAIGLWKFIDGQFDTQPIVPALITGTTVTGTDVDGTVRTITTAGNEDAVKKATKDAEPWWTTNKRILSLIVDAVPSHKLYIVRDCKTAKEAWDALRQHYKPSNQIRATHMKTQLNSFVYQPQMSPEKWLSTMQNMYNELCDLDPSGKMMTDDQFARQLIEQMPQEDEWRTIASTLMNKLRESDGDGTKLTSKYVMGELREEAWRVARRNHNPKETVGGSVFSTTGGGRTSSRKQVAPETTDRYKRARTTSYRSDYPISNHRTLHPGSRSAEFCENEYCERPIGHTKAKCYAYGGGLVGKHTEDPKYRGPDDIHIHPDIRRKIRREKALNTTRTGGRGAYINPYQATSHHVDVPTVNTRVNWDPQTGEADDEHEVHAILDNEAPLYNLNTTVDEAEIVSCAPRALSLDTPLTDDTFHDSGATRHVFCNRSAFADYKELARPILVKAFGRKTFAEAVGIGKVKLAATLRDGSAVNTILSEVIHVPSGRCNLISQTALDKKGVKSYTGDGHISLIYRDRCIMEGKISSDLYKLDVTTSATKLQSDPLSIAINAINADDRGDFYIA